MSLITVLQTPSHGEMAQSLNIWQVKQKQMATRNVGGTLSFRLPSRRCRDAL